MHSPYLLKRRSVAVAKVINRTRKMRPDLCMKISWGCEDSYLSYQLHQRFEIAVGEPYPHLSGTLWQSCSEVLSCLSLAAAFSFLLGSSVLSPMMWAASYCQGHTSGGRLSFWRAHICQHWAAALPADHRRFGTSSSSKCIWAAAELPAVLDAVWEGVWPDRSYILSAWRSHAFGALGVVIPTAAKMWP